MATEEKVYSQEQVSDTRRMCQIIKEATDERHKLCTIFLMAYMNGLEAGMAWKNDEKEFEQIGKPPGQTAEGTEKVENTVYFW